MFKLMTPARCCSALSAVEALQRLFYNRVQLAGLPAEDALKLLLVAEVYNHKASACWTCYICVNSHARSVALRDKECRRPAADKGT